MRGELERDGFTVASHSWSRSLIRLHASRTIECPDCGGTGLADLTDEFAQHVLDAQPVQHGKPAVYAWAKPGNPASIEALHVLADQLREWECTACWRPTPPRAGGCRYCGEQLRPNPLAPLGLHIGMLLAGRREGTTDAVAQLGSSQELEPS